MISTTTLTAPPSDAAQPAAASTQATGFAELGISAPVVASLAKRGLTEAFAIQASALPAALAGRDVCGRAPTGSGKTLAFALPVVERVSRAKPHRPRALILTPTRELAAQIAEELRLLTDGHTRIATFYGGVGFGNQLAALRKGVDIAVACPGRLADLIRRGDCHLGDVEIAVLDEADRMADMGFLPEVRRLLDQVRPDRQTLLFSATLDGDVDILVRRYQHDPVRCEVAPSPQGPDRTSHEFRSVPREQRVNVAAGLAAEHGSTVVFCRTKRGADRVARQLDRAGVAAVAIHGGRTQGQRDRALAAFTSGRAQVLVATDVAARGIHVDGVNCVVHFDLAGDAKDYVHRSGRTGRAGAQGTVVTLVTTEDTASAKALQRQLGLVTDDGRRSSGSDGIHRPSRGSGNSGRSGNSRRRSRNSRTRHARNR